MENFQIFLDDNVDPDNHARFRQLIRDGVNNCHDAVTVINDDQLSLCGSMVKGECTQDDDAGWHNEYQTFFPKMYSITPRGGEPIQISTWAKLIMVKLPHGELVMNREEFQKYVDDIKGLAVYVKILTPDGREPATHY